MPRYRFGWRQPIVALALFLPLAGQAALPRPAAAQQVTIVDVMPQPQSNEINADSEPSLAIDPATPSHMAATTFTPDPKGNQMGTVFLSTDGGMTWTLQGILPGSSSGQCKSGFCDVTLRFASFSGRLYMSDLTSDPKGNIVLRVSRFQDIFGAATPETLETRLGPLGNAPDQPYLQATTAFNSDGSSQDKVFVGVNDARATVVPKSATVDVLANAGGPLPVAVVQARIDARSPFDRDGSSVRTAIHNDGIVYAAFYSELTAHSANLVVVRDDHFGAGNPPWSDLKDASQVAGIIVQPTISYDAGEKELGNQKVGRSQISIAVDPNDSQSVWLAWGDASTSVMTLHLRHSANGGQTWSGDLRTVKGATNPALAVTSTGEVGFLYQMFFYNGFQGLWYTQLELSADFQTSPTPLVLSMAPDDFDTVVNDHNELGDYLYMMAVGKDFFGIFSADNSPESAAFPAASKVVFQREHDAHTLYDTTHTSSVQTSVDPFFFHVATVNPENDFFVRDWTDSTGHDLGDEPSTHPVFVYTSDVWNELTNASGSPATGSAPPHTDPVDGQNFAFVRIGRKSTVNAAPADVQARFFYSDFGVGMPYADMGNGTPATISFGASDAELTLADGAGYAWTLPATHSSHICMAVEITGPADPPAKPGLAGGVPGWPTLDTAVIYDNNKAQRNIHYPKGASGTKPHYYALARNAAPVQKDLCLRLDSSALVLRELGSVQIDACGLGTVSYRPGATVCLPALAPGEVRPVGVTINLPATAVGLDLPVIFTEVTGPEANAKPRDGFAISPRPSAVEDAARYNLTFERAVYGRLAAIYKDANAANLTAQTRDLLSKNPAISVATYVDFLKKQASLLSRLVALLPRPTAACSPSPSKDLERFTAALTAGDPVAIADAHSDFLQTLDIATTLAEP